MKRIKLEFDKRAHPHGSKEHFWHFMLGYLLPSVHFYFKKVSQQKKGNIKKALLLYEDCGPLMNPMIIEMTNLLEIPFDIIYDTEEKETKTFDEMIYLPRWDIRLFASLYFVFHKKRFNSDIPIHRKDAKGLLNLNLRLRRKAFGINLKRDILFTRNLILKKLNRKDEPSNQSFLLLDRSDANSYYKPEGKAEMKGYGKSRRYLKNLDEESISLNESGLFTEIFQPGSYSLLHQIATFNSAKGIIGIRGAEFANMMWLEPGSKVVVIGFMEPSFHLYNYACILDLKLTERCSDTDHPNINNYDIKKILKE